MITPEVVIHSIIWIVTVNPAQSASEEKEIAAPVSTSKATSSEDAGQQTLITHKMRNVLEGDLGHHLNEVDEMHPEEKKIMKCLNSEFYECYLWQMAREAIEKKLPRRSSGMPDSWRRKKTSDLAASDADAYSKG